MAGRSKAGRDISNRLTKIATAVDDGRRDVLFAAAKAAKESQLDLMRRDVGSDLRISRMGRNGAKVGVRYDMRGSDRVEVKATGPLHIVANPTKPHRIPKERARGRRRVVVIPGVGVRSYARHPGTHGKNTWWRGADEAARRAADVMGDEWKSIVRRAFS